MDAILDVILKNIWIILGALSILGFIWLVANKDKPRPERKTPPLPRGYDQEEYDAAVKKGVNILNVLAVLLICVPICLLIIGGLLLVLSETSGPAGDVAATLLEVIEGLLK